MKKIILLLTVILLPSCYSTPKGGAYVLDADRSSGTIEIGFSYTNEWIPINPNSFGEQIDWQQGEQEAIRVCHNWGYSKEISPINHNIQRRINRGSTFNMISATWWKKYQCVGNPNMKH